MNLASGTIILVLLAIPGFATLFGFYVFSRLSGQLRDVTPKSQAGEIAMVVLLAFILHGIMAILLAAVHSLVLAVGVPFPSLGIGTLFEAIQGACDPWTAACRPTALIASHGKAIAALILYILGTSMLGMLVGRGAITFVEEQKGGERFKWFHTKRFHSWTYDFICGPQKPWVLSTVLTNIVQNGVYVGYRGVLDQMTLDSDQNIKTVLLTGVYKVYLPLKEFPTKDEGLRPFMPVDADGRDVTLETHGRVAHEKGGDIPKLVVPGSTILNLSMEPTKLESDEEGAADLRETLLRMGGA